MKFRSDIQILRAIAVLCVLFFHLGIGAFSSGFLGVDVFFVVSGFLMEKLYAQNKGPMHFYTRRAKRLLPAYFLVVLATLLACWFVTLPPDFAQAGQQAVFAAGFASNVGFWLQNSYFSKIEFNPLLHLWSLGVEIQYYLFVPLIVWAAARWRGALPALILLSLCLCLVVVQVSPKTSFFMMPLRLWEFGLGMLAARLAPEETRRSAAGLAGIAAIIVCMMLPVDGEATSILRGHPAAAALAIALATASVLYFGVEERLLAYFPGRVLRRVGDMSYSVYLVHFPIIVLWFYTPFGGTHLGDGSWRPALILAPLIAAAAALSYFGAERRGGRYLSPALVVAAMVVTGALGLLLPAAQLRSFPPYQRAIFSAWTDRAPYRCGIGFRLRHPRGQFCVAAPAAAARETVMLLGDSHADSIRQSFNRAAFAHGSAVAFAVSNEPLLSPGRGPEWMVAQARSLGVRRVFLHYAFHNLTTALVEDARRANAAAGIETLLILPVPEASEHVPQAMYRASLSGRRLAPLARSDYERRLAPLMAYLAEPHPMLTVVDPRTALCDPAACAVAQADGRPYYFDTDHLTLLGARRLEPLLGRALARGGAETR